MYSELKKALTARLLLRIDRKNRDFSDQMVVFSNDHIANNINIYGQYAKQELAFLETAVFPHLEGGIALDIGANIGNHALFFAKHFSQVIAFEPNRRTFELLSINARHAGNIRCFAFGASDRNARLQAEHNFLNVGSSRIVTQSNGNTDKTESTFFDVKILDEILEAAATPRIDFIKIDVEGHELPALKGLAKTLAKDQPVVAFESLVTGAGNTVPEYLRSLGYLNFYEMRSSHILDKLPRWPRRIGKLGALLVGAGIDPRYRLAKIDDMSGKDISLVIASVAPL